MPLFEAFVLIFGIAYIVGHFAYKKAYREGIEDGTEATLAVLENEGLIVVDDEGAVRAPARPRRSRRKT